MRRSAFKFRSSAFMGTSFPNITTVPFPQSSDPDTWVWYSTDKYITKDGDNGVYTWGNRMDYQANKTNRIVPGTTNLVPYGSSPPLSRTDNNGNLMATSNNMGGGTWSSSGATINSATTATFAAQNGRFYSFVPSHLHEGRQLTLRVKIRRISGNTNLVCTYDAGNSGPGVTIDGTLTQYSFTFTPSSKNINLYVGLKDENAGGWGQIEVQDWHLIISDSPAWGTTFVETTGIRAFPCVTSTNMPSVVLTQESWFAFYDIGTNGFSASAFTIYMTIRNVWKNNGHLFTFSNQLYDLLISNTGGEGQLRLYTNYPSGKDNYSSAGFLTDKTWYVLTFTGTYNGAVSFRKNLEAAQAGATGMGVPSTNNRFQWGAYNYDGGAACHQCTEMIWRKKVDNATTQEAYIRYLADRAGIVV